MSVRTQLDLLKPRPRYLRYVCGFLGLFIGTMLAKITIKGRHHLPKKGPFIVSVNHFNLVDSFFSVFAIQRPVAFLMGSDQTIDWFNYWALWLYGVIPVNRKRMGPSTIKIATQYIKAEEILAIFPEGSLGLSLRKPKPGAVYLSTLGQVPIIPLGIHGVDQPYFHYIFRGIRPTIFAQFGKPMGPFKLPSNKQDREKKLEKIGDEMMCHIAALLPETMHGEYAGNPSIKKYRSENIL